jgi:hypothetical protein
VDKVINLRILSHPMNYLVVWVILGFGVFAHSLLAERLGSLPDHATS